MLTEMQVKNAREGAGLQARRFRGAVPLGDPKVDPSWRMKCRFAGKESRLVLGTYLDLGPREVRDRKADARKLLREGRHPGIEAAKARPLRAVASASTFEALARC